MSQLAGVHRPDFHRHAWVFSALLLRFPIWISSYRRYGAVLFSRAGSVFVLFFYMMCVYFSPSCRCSA